MKTQLEGAWQFETALLGGKDITATMQSMHLVIDKNEFRIKQGEVTVDYGTLTFSEGTNHLDLFGIEGPGKGNLLHAIYKCVRDEMIICYNLDKSGSYPSDFESPEGSTNFLVHYKSKRT